MEKKEEKEEEEEEVVVQVEKDLLASLPVWATLKKPERRSRHSLPRRDWRAVDGARSCNCCSGLENLKKTKASSLDKAAVTLRSILWLPDDLAATVCLGAAWWYLGKNVREFRCSQTSTEYKQASPCTEHRQAAPKRHEYAR
ncbi:hypothetical protein O3P69_005852 [Scylla paramamosain]|uniref:Uncharacterized protein n=1 Tax=Scylla paramamosain TaxID=85552 RepID=A0AAW0U553_SCYPA